MRTMLLMVLVLISRFSFAASESDPEVIVVKASPGIKCNVFDGEHEIAITENWGIKTADSAKFTADIKEIRKGDYILTISDRNNLLVSKTVVHGFIAGQEIEHFVWANGDSFKIHCK